MGFYAVFKNGSLQCYEHRPKARVYVEETVMSMGEQQTRHTLLKFDASGVPQYPAQIMDCYCGFDRGPKLTAQIRRMLT